MLYQKTGPTDFDKLRIIDSSNNEGTNSRVMGKSGEKGWFVGRGHTKGAIKFDMQWYHAIVLTVVSGIVSIPYIVLMCSNTMP